MKVCGITRAEDAELAVSLGAWALGFIFVRSSPRYIEPSRAHAIIAGLKRPVVTVGVFVDSSAEEIRTAVKAKGLSNLCVPREIKVVQEIPKLGTGKINHRELAALIKDK